MRLHGEFECDGASQRVQVYMPSFMDGWSVDQNVAQFSIKFFSNSLDPALLVYRVWEDGLVFDYGLPFGDGANTAIFNIPGGMKYAFFQLTGSVPKRVGEAKVNLRIALF